MKGSYRKRGNTWEFTVDLGKDPTTGKRKRKSKSGFKTKKAAQAAANELMNQYNKGEYFEVSNKTFEDFINEWIENRASRTLRASTLDTHKWIIDKHLIPAFGDMPLGNIKPKDIDSFYKEKEDAGYSSDYIVDMHSILRKSLKVAIEWEYIQKNPVEAVSPPRIKAKEIQTWTMEESNSFLKHTEEEPLHIAYVLAIYTGMRKGEILGLRWKDVDLDFGRISITQTLTRTRDGLDFQEPKTRGSKRNISITPYVIEELKKRRKQINENKLLLGPTGYAEYDLVVCNNLGNPIDPRNLLRHFDKMIKQSQLSKIRFHDLRHTHATILLKLGEHPKVVSERLGHSRIGITLDTYSHVIPDMQKDTANKFEQAMRQTR
ncbi:tyrosine-type recombinase/integrase [Pseudalkalibacillus caeni]|uniref:Site-specific integrase n=1 Tax=Exobacillus caeni TaxID=2574798 RepID=A0A5R9F617_9BACL|nr:tyrosine-type recombinase/integrase [Pseudalkalibacillus caeni]TLS37776.1 site-specific integrase [Pseudalkalibacillus caeni]